MTRMRIATFFALAAVVGLSVSCGNLIREGRAPVFLVINSLTASGSGFLNSDVQRATGVSDDPGSVVLTAFLKDVLGTPTNPAGPTTNNNVTINRIHIAYRRADGRSIPGVDVPYAFDAAATGTVSVGSTLGLSFELVRHVAKVESPLVELVNADAGIITTLADVTFYGRDQVGNEVNVTGTIQINFGNFAG
jgi:hypothetical protein